MSTGFRSVREDIIGEQDVPQAVREAQARALARSERRGGTQRDPEVKVLAQAEIRAKWKIEVMFGAKRSIQGPNAVGIQIWESGKHFHGGGDALAYFCKNRENVEEGCGGIIGEDNVANGFAYCPHCRRTVNAELLLRITGGKLSSQNLAREVARLWHQLECNADIYVKYWPDDPRYLEMERRCGRKVAERLKGLQFYALKNILKDTNAGADVVKRFHALFAS